eukprot:scaffold1945_cov181-Ochromonas_danica.AAC.4
MALVKSTEKKLLCIAPSNGYYMKRTGETTTVDLSVRSDRNGVQTRFWVLDKTSIELSALSPKMENVMM